MAVNLIPKPEKSGGVIPGLYIRVAVAGPILTLALLGCGVREGPSGPGVMGKVRDASTGEPVSGASVTVGGKSAVTAWDGSFILHGVRPGLQLVTVQKNEYQTYSGNALVGGGVTILPDIYLLPLGAEGHGALFGTVVDPMAREPGVVGATVRLYDSKETLVGTTTSGYMGTFRFDSVPAGGPYTVEAEKLFLLRLFGKAEGIFVKAEGATSNVTVIMAEESVAGRVEGNVKSASDGSPVAGATVTATVFGKFSVSALSGREGKFEIHPLPPGMWWEVSASAPGFLSASKRVSVPKGGKALVDFPLQPRSEGGLLPSVEALRCVAYTYPHGASRRRAVYKAALKALGVRGPLPKFGEAPTRRGMPPGFLHEVVLEWSTSSGDLSRAQGFEILRGLDPQGLSPRERIRSPLARFFSDLDLRFNAGAVYFYGVRAFSDDVSGPTGKAQAAILPAVHPEHPPDGLEVLLPLLTFRAEPVPLAQAYFVQTLRTDPASGVEEEVWTGGPYSGSQIKEGVLYQGPLLPLGTTLYWVMVATDNPEPEQASSVSISELRRLIVK